MIAMPAYCRPKKKTTSNWLTLAPCTIDKFWWFLAVRCTIVLKSYACSAFDVPSFLLTLFASEYCWRRGSVVRTSVFGWRTSPWSMPDLWLTYGHFVGKVSAMGGGEPTRPTQLHGQKNIITCITGWRPLSGKPGLRMAVWLQVKVRGRPLCLWHESAATAAVCGLWHYISVICLYTAHSREGGRSALLGNTKGESRTRHFSIPLTTMTRAAQREVFYVITIVLRNLCSPWKMCAIT